MFTVSSGSTTLGSKTVNLQVPADDGQVDSVHWEDIGNFTISQTDLVVHLTQTDTLALVADAVRIERTDGTPIVTPKVTGVIPRNSPLSGGIEVRIIGRNFVSGARVKFGTKEVASDSFLLKRLEQLRLLLSQVLWMLL